MSEFPAIRILFSFIGILIILLALLTQKLQPGLGIKSRSEVFTIPGFRRSASTIKRLGQWLCVIIGVGFLIQGIGTLLLPNAGTDAILMILTGFAGVIVLILFGVVLAYWKIRSGLRKVHPPLNFRQSRPY
jgi:hypothetical protein